MKRIVCVCLLLMSLILFVAAEEAQLPADDAQVKAFLQSKNGNYSAFDRLLSDYLAGEMEKKLSGDFRVTEAAAAIVDETWRLMITGYYKEVVPFRFSVLAGNLLVLIPDAPCLWEGDNLSRWWSFDNNTEDAYAHLKSTFEDHLKREYPYAEDAINEKRPLNPLDRITPMQAAKGSFTKNKKYDVYQGPGTVYGRSGGGKGVVSTNGAINCYGTHNDWLLVEYEISKTKHRYGWIRLSNLYASQADDYSKLNFSKDEDFHICGVLTQDAALTDDPFYSGNAVKQLPAGKSVFVLMRDKDFLLVEGFLGKERFMGFVPADAVDMKYGYAEKTVFSIDEAKTYAEADIYAAMEAVKDAVYEHFSGTGLLSVSYIEKESADPTAWWQPDEENREGVKLFADLSSMNLYDYEIAANGVAKKYLFILYRDKSGGEWEVGNWGYE